MTLEPDIYAALLGISPREGRPPHYYILFGLDPFEDDPDVILRKAEMQIQYIDQVSKAKYDRIDDLIRELNDAKECLLNPEQKRKYDAQLREKLTPRVWRIGSQNDCDIVVPDSHVSRLHAALHRTPQGYFLEDLRSANGVFVNGQPIRERTRVRPSDRITLGRRVPLPWPGELPEAEPGALLAASHVDAPPIVPANLDSQANSPAEIDCRITIGRAPDNVVVIEDDTVSAHHAELLVLPGGNLELVDLKSSNGTYVVPSPARISRRPVQSGDIVRLGVRELHVADLLAAARAG